MDHLTLNYLKIIFILGFTLHNLEEAVWLPRWSHFAEKFHKPVEPDEFIFAVIVITIFGYLLTVLDFLTGAGVSFINYIYLGFVGMMGLNTILPHLLAAFVLKRYSPGLITGLLLNLPLSIIIIFGSVRNGTNVIFLIFSILIVSGVVVSSLKFLFRVGKALTNFRA